MSELIGVIDDAQPVIHVEIQGAGPQGLQGEKGDPGPAPEHQWVDTTKLQFKQPDGFWGTATQLKGQPGDPGDDGKGWTGGSYDDETGIVTFTSADGLGFATDDLRGADGMSAYEAAVEGNYEGDEEDFYEDLAALQGLADELADI